MFCYYCSQDVLLTEGDIRPIRLIDVYKKEIVNTEQICKNCYNVGNICVITHVWGNTKKYDSLHTQIKGLTWDIALSNENKLNDILSGCKQLSVKWCWLDTVCIKQDDDDEKAIEIPKMSFIYKTSTFCALYRDEFDDNDAYKLNKTLEKITPNLSDHKTTICQVIPGQAKLTECLWAERIWTLQETILPKKLVFITKNYVVDFSNILMMLSVAYNEWSHWREYLRNDYIHINIIKILMSKSDVLTYSQVVNLISDRDSMYMHDRIYGIIGVLDVVIEVDYTQSHDKLVNKLIFELTKKGDWSWIGCIDTVNNIFGHSLEPNILTKSAIDVQNNDAVTKISNNITQYNISLLFYGQVIKVIRNISDTNIIRNAFLLVSGIIHLLYGWGGQGVVHIGSVREIIKVEECFAFLNNIIKIMKTSFEQGVLEDGANEQLKRNISKSIWAITQLTNDLLSLDFEPTLVCINGPNSELFIGVGVGNIKEQDVIYMTKLSSSYGKLLMVVTDLELTTKQQMLRRKGWILSDFDVNTEKLYEICVIY